ncbi:unnamed protein product [Urochloa decumbens]|uniref:Glutamate receptor n=2 Tax=Urochloa decumbens TaxID=240449 RepID=A0ABC9DSE3_9POAL
MPITSILTSFSGREVIMVCEDSPYGLGILQPLSDALESNGVHMMDSVIVPIGVADYHLDQVLRHLKEMPARLFIVHMRPALGLHLFSRAISAGMVTEDYVWIATAALGNVVGSLSPDEIDYLQGVVTLRPYVQATRNVKNFSARFKARFHLENPDTDLVQSPSVLLFWAYDTVWTIATAAEIAGLSIWMAETDLGGHGVYATRRILTDSILNIAFDGLAGNFKLVSGELELPSYEIVNVTSKDVVGVGLWTPLSLQPQNLSRESYSFGTSRSGSGTVNPVFLRDGLVLNLKVRDKTEFPLKLESKRSLNPESGRSNSRKLAGGNSGKMCSGYTKKPLRIGVPLKDGFKTFVNVSHPYFFCKDNSTRPSTTKQVTGYIIDVFEAAMKKLQHPLCYDFCVFDGSYDELVGNVSLGNLDGAAGDVTITIDRIGKVDFTMPYTQSGVSMLVLSKSDLEPIQWTFLAPLTKELWVATVGFFCFTGFVVWVIERPKNPEYQGSSLRQFSTASYFAFSTLTFSHGHIIRSPMSRIAVVIWCFVVLVLVQSYTASFSSILTAERLRPSVTNLDQLLFNHDYVGYQHGSFVCSMLKNRGFSKHRLIPYSNEDEYAEALRRGSMNGGVSAIVDEVPFLTSFLFSDTRYQNEFQIVDHVYKTPGLGFVFPLGFPLLHNISTAILNITEGNEGPQIEAKWLGTAAAPPTVSNTPSTPLTLQSFSGLFLTSGFISSLMLLISVVRLAHARWMQANSTGNIPSLDQPYNEAGNRNCQDVHEGSGSGGDEESGTIQYAMGNSSVSDRTVNEATSSDSRCARRSSDSAGREELGAVQNGVHDGSGSAPAKSLGVEKNIG